MLASHVQSQHLGSWQRNIIEFEASLLLLSVLVRFVNFTQIRVMWEERTIFKELPLLDSSVNISLGIFLMNNLWGVGGPQPSVGSTTSGQAALRYISQQAGQAKESNAVNSFLPQALLPLLLLEFLPCLPPVTDWRVAWQTNKPIPPWVAVVCHSNRPRTWHTGRTYLK